jgi:phage tail sheath gpL-like
MSSFQTILLESPLPVAGFKSVCDLAPGQLPALNNFADFVSAVTGGNQMAKFSFNVGAVKATGSLTVAAGGSTAGQACTIGNVTLTGRASNPAANEFVVSATAATQAANMAAAINASTSLSPFVVASASLGVVTLTAVMAGALGNGFQLSAGNLGNVTASAFASGADGTLYSINLL